MNTNHSFKVLIAAAGFALGLAAIARAGEDPAAALARAGSTPAVDEPAPLVGQGLLGQSYVSGAYGFVNFDDTHVDAHALTFDYNRPVTEGFDTFANFRALRSQSIGGGRLKTYDVLFGARLYRFFNGVKPYWEAGLGWGWGKAPGFDDNTLTWESAVGVEVPVATGLSLTPYAQFTDAVDFPDGDFWTYGVKGNYWLNSRTAVLGTIERRHDESTEYRVGVNFRF